MRMQTSNNNGVVQSVWQSQKMVRLTLAGQKRILEQSEKRKKGFNWNLISSLRDPQGNSLAWPPTMHTVHAIKKDLVAP